MSILSKQISSKPIFRNRLRDREFIVGAWKKDGMYLDRCYRSSDIVHYVWRYGTEDARPSNRQRARNRRMAFAPRSYHFIGADEGVTY